MNTLQRNNPLRTSTAKSSLTPDQLGQLACWALHEEAALAPKPALVDSRGNGAHSDMQLSLMQASATTLQPWFAAMAELPERYQGLALRMQLGALGRQAEADMLRTTAGINTHRGAIWALGLLVCAAAQTDAQAGSKNNTSSITNTLQHAAALARITDPALPKSDANPSKGLTACRQYKVTGAREEAQQGFPHIHQLALPELRNSRANGETEDVARLNALLAIMSSLTDTCVLSRAGMEGLLEMQQGARDILQYGGFGSRAGKARFGRYEQQLLALRASAGGAADLLAATLLLDRLYPQHTDTPSSRLSNAPAVWATTDQQ
ncbi:triphosphoribosyl-dephospho-CoA synthase [Oceanobacter kriegii]|uniref:triphosphoribosyl-dephospho-CoA synthase n=1 Tax=Oceanobacter kriegii TaxID=64972 RepID=UPI000408CB1C|nr:triphosphoribosyl-dephospho-CoA synthase [Oceanobacter kriegii]